MSWVYLLQINVRLASRKQIKSHQLTTEMRHHGTDRLSDTGQRGVFTLSGRDVWLKMQKKSDYWCDYWRVHESHLFTSGKDSIPFFCLPFNSIMTFFFSIWGQPLPAAEPVHTHPINPLHPQVTELQVSSRALKENCGLRWQEVTRQNHTEIPQRHTKCSEDFHINRALNRLASCPW